MRSITELHLDLIEVLEGIFDPEFSHIIMLESGKGGR